MPENHDRLLTAALGYADLGYPVFPCAPGTKIPVTEHGFQNASVDPAQIEAWWQARPNANIGIPTAGLLVVDVDGANNPWLSGEPEKAQDLAPGAVSLTPRGGRHYVFRQPSGVRWKSTASRLAPGVDVRAEGGYIVAPPSVFEGREYRWAEALALDCPPDGLPEPPAWLARLLDGISGSNGGPANRAACPPWAFRSPDGSGEGNPIPSGQRNSALASLAGTMRRVGMGREPILAALLKTNELHCKPPLAMLEVERIAASICRYEPDQIAVAVAENHWAQDRAQTGPQGLEDLEMKHRALRPPVIHGLLREGETMNVISAPKIGKSWLVIDLALSIAAGRAWLGQFECERGSVLVIDNELHSETSASRIPRVRDARGITKEEIKGRVFIQNLRGHLKDLFSLGPYFEQFEPGRFKMVILDAFYRFLPMKVDENDNGTMASLYNYLDSFADRLKCCFVLIHHTSKGNQSAKELTDVGAGAGAQSRATDTHLVLRRHEEEDVVVLDAAVRSWPPPPQAPMCLRWTFPVWTPAPDLDPADLKRERPAKKPRDEKPPEPVWDVERFVEAFVSEEPRIKGCIIEAAVAQGLSEHRAGQLLKRAEGAKLVHRWRSAANKPVEFSTTPQPDPVPEAKEE